MARGETVSDKRKPSAIKRSTGFILRLFVWVSVILTVLLTVGPFCVKLALPALSRSIEILGSDYEILESASAHNGKETVIRFKVRINREAVDPQGNVWPASIATVGVSPFLLYLYPAIVLSLIAAWPRITVKRRLQAGLIALPLIVLAIILDIPFHVAYYLERSYGCETVGAHLRVYWYHFLNTGGRQFLALAVFLVSMVVRPGKYKVS